MNKTILAIVLALIFGRLVPVLLVAMVFTLLAVIIAEAVKEGKSL